MWPSRPGWVNSGPEARGIWLALTLPLLWPACPGVLWVAYWLWPGISAVPAFPMMEVPSAVSSVFRSCIFAEFKPRSLFFGLLPEPLVIFGSGNQFLTHWVLTNIPDFFFKTLLMTNDMVKRLILPYCSTSIQGFIN